MRIVVVGASLGGVRTVEALRRRGSDAEIVIVGDEPGAPEGVAADRPPLSKKFLSDPAGTAPALITPAGLAELDVRLVHGRAVALDLRSRHVTLRDAGPLSFDSLVVATGSTPREVPGLEPRPGVVALRTATDAAAIRDACAEGGPIVVVGGGFVGTEVAWSLRARGHQVALVEPLPTLLRRALDPQLGAAIARRHSEAGIDLHLGAAVAALEGANRIEAVRLTDGSRLPAAAVVLGLGTVPATDWLTGSGIRVCDGVVCDEGLAAVGAEGVYAVGDAVRWRHPRYAEELRVEHWTNAVETAEVVAENLTGGGATHGALPYVWTEQLGARLQIFGRQHPQDELRVVYGGLDGAFVAVTGGQGRLHSVIGMGALKQLLPYRKLLVDGAPWPVPA